MRGQIGGAFALLVVGAILISGCVPSGNAGSGGSAGGAATPEASRALFGGSFRVSAPTGFCIDPDASHEEEETAVVVMRRCAGGDATVISASIGGLGSSQVLASGARALSDWFVAPEGRAALARDGKADSVRVRQTALSDGALVLDVEDRLAGRYWRAFFGVKTRLVTLSVLSDAAQAQEPEAARLLLDRAMTLLRNANSR